MNNAPVFGYEEHAGSRTTIRLIYPEAASFLAQEYQNTDIVALVAFKSLDLEWLTSIITKKPLVSILAAYSSRLVLLFQNVTEWKQNEMKIDTCLQSWWNRLWFWRDVVNDIPLHPGSFRILNPEIFNRTWHVLKTYGKHEGKVGPVACRKIFPTRIIYKLPVLFMSENLLYIFYLFKFFNRIVSMFFNFKLQKEVNTHAQCAFCCVVDGAYSRHCWRGVGATALWWIKPGRLWLRLQTSWISAPLLRDSAHGPHDGTSSAWCQQRAQFTEGPCQVWSRAWSHRCSVINSGPHSSNITWTYLLINGWKEQLQKKFVIDENPVSGMYV